MELSEKQYMKLVKKLYEYDNAVPFWLITIDKNGQYGYIPNEKWIIPSRTRYQIYV